MATIDNLLDRVQDSDLRNLILAEVNKLRKQKKFGLVFEEHLPECTILYEVPVKKGANVTLRDNKAIEEIFTVKSITKDIALCESINEFHQTKEIPVADLVVVAQFGEPIYPYLKPIDSICNAPDSDLWHTLIEADNYHALQLLEYLYAGKVDCIYIDPPYNTGARDWKYNNDYVDGADSYRHSKWLSMMEKRLKIAKKLLNPKDSVLIVTIDEKEYLHLGCLLEDLFPEARLQMVSSVINPAGVSRGSDFARTDEYIYVIQLGNSAIVRLPLGDEWRLNAEDKRTTKMLWSMLIRTGTHTQREDSPNQFYPIFVYHDGSKIHSVGEPFYGNNLADVIAPDGTIAIWPIRSNGTQGNWQVSNINLREYIQKGYVKLGRFSERGMAISYLKKGEIAKVENGIYEITGRREDGSIISDSEYRSIIPGTQWRIPSHDASRQGTNLLTSIIGKRFSFPKSLYAEHDTIRFFVANKPNALILDFFAGSGTTLHAVNLLNAEDGGHRRCIMVTNNEVSDEEAKSLTKQGYRPEDKEWYDLGIARYVNWPRTTCSIKGIDINGCPLKGDYISDSSESLHMSDGFKTNAAFLKLGFLNKTSVALGRQFKELIPILWMKAGAVNECPSLSEGESIPNMLIFPKNKFAVLVNEKELQVFKNELVKYPQIETVYIVTDSEDGYQEIASELNVKATYQLYRDYLDNFKINNYR